MAHIFLSYSRKDIDFMQQLRDDLRAEGLDIWTDESLVTGSKSWKQDVEHAIEESAALIVILTPNSKKSVWVREEMNYAEAQNVRIFPVLASGTPKESVPFGFITAQWVDLRDDREYMSELQKLMFTLRSHLALEIADEETSIVSNSDDADSSKEPPPIHKTTLAPDAPTRQKRTRVVFPSNISKAILLLQDRETKWWKRRDAVTLLGNLKDPIVIPVLEAYLEDYDIDVRYAAELAIEKIKTPPEDLDEEQIIVPDDGPLEDDTLTAPPTSTDASNSDHTPHEKPSDDKRLKLVVTSPLDDLRNRFISAVSEIKPVVISRELGESGLMDSPQTAAMSFGRITVEDDLMIYLFGMPGQRQFDFMWKVLTVGMLGFVFIVDSTQPHTFRDAKAILEKCRSNVEMPYVIAADNSNQSDAWRPVDIRIAMRLDSEARVVPCVSSDPESVKKVLLELIYTISEE